MKKRIITESQLNALVDSCVRRYIRESEDEDVDYKVMAEVHYYDAKGRGYKLEHLADELRNLGIEVQGIGFNSDYDGYVNVLVNREQARMLDNSKYGKRLYIIGRGSTFDELFDDAVRIDKMCNNTHRQ